MRRPILTGLVVAAALGLCAGLANAADVQWAKSFDSALAEAKKTNKLVMADFYTDW